ncbi:hypothetical protein FRB90_004004 [Tulasnella sp. 427]|nr:hypothetical protein FRB90_004004 [Tulasnella sp. 427]
MGFIDVVTDGITTSFNHAVDDTINGFDRAFGKDGEVTKILERVPGVSNAIVEVHEALGNDEQAKRAKESLENSSLNK